VKVSGWIYTRAMTAERHELHEPVDELPEDQAAAALGDVRRRLGRNNGRAWSPEFRAQTF
jgi:hypothetical protein